MKTMELDMWNDDMLAGDLCLSLPDDHSGGLFDDIKSYGCLCGDDSLSLQLQDAVERVRGTTPFKHEDVLGMEWLESSDLGSFLEIMDNSQEKMLPLEAKLIEYTLLIGPEEPITSDELFAKQELPKLQQNRSSLEDFSVGQESKEHPPPTFDALLSSPSSPEQVAPDVKIEPATITQAGALKIYPADSHFLFSDNTFEASVSDDGVIFDGLDLTVGSTDDSVITFDDPSTSVGGSDDSVITFDVISSPLSVNDVESMLSNSTPTSPSSSSISSIIESSPELYKIILTPSSGSDKRFSPYGKTKPTKAGKSSSRSRPPAEPVPEYIIGEQLNKKDRKKLQNKNAAIRYRMKKKEEAVGIKSEEQLLEERNVELRTKVDDLSREIKYMKNLIEDVCRAKGLI